MRRGCRYGLFREGGIASGHEVHDIESGREESGRVRTQPPVACGDFSVLGRLWRPSSRNDNYGRLRANINRRTTGLRAAGEAYGRFAFSRLLLLIISRFWAVAA